LVPELNKEWAATLAGDGEAQARWWVDEGGGAWGWQPDGVVLEGDGPGWSALGWRRCDAATLTGLQNFLVEVTVSGTAQAAGLSFGPYKDFLVPLHSDAEPRRLQLEVDAASGCWVFRADGQLILERRWWDRGVNSVADILSGVLTMKALSPEHVVFRDLSFTVFQASCQLTVVMVCHRFLHRLRISLRNWCHQQSPTGSYEVLVVNPQSPDGTGEHLAAVARSYPNLRIRELTVDHHGTVNKGSMINHAVRASRGAWIWLTDADCVFGPSSSAIVMSRLGGDTSRLLFGQRRFLTCSQTDTLLSGQADGLSQFDALCANSSPRPPDHTPWGYTQIVHRSTIETLGYPEEFNHFAHNDLVFVENCRRAGIKIEPVDGLFCLHLDHPFAWYGTDHFL
jgi:hypothetical protein